MTNKKIKIDDSYSAYMGCSSIPVSQVPGLLNSIALDPTLRFKILVNLVSKAGFGKTYSVFEAAYHTYVSLLYNSELYPKMEAQKLYIKENLIIPNKKNFKRIVKEYGVQKFSEKKVYQEARNIKFHMTIMMTSQKLPEDFAGIPIFDPKTEKIKQIPLSELPQDPEVFYYLFFDEINRTDPSVLKPIFQLLDQRKVGEHLLPLSCVLVAAMNPDNESYGVTSLEPAITRRLCFIEVTNNYSNWLTWAKENDIHPIIRKYILEHKDKLFDDSAHHKGQVFANPASWEKASLLLKKYSKYEFQFLTPLLSGYLGQETAKDIMQKYRSILEETLSVTDVLDNYFKTRNSVKVLISEGKISNISVSIEKILSTFCLAYKEDEVTQRKYSDNFTTFLGDLPDDSVVTCLHNLTTIFKELLHSDLDNETKITQFKTKFYSLLFSIPEMKLKAQLIFKRS